MPDRRDVAVAIGVSSAGSLDYLGGAVNGARAFHDWATQMGYASRLVTDETDEVTIPRLRSELETALKPENVPIHRFLIYFAGHGLIREAEEGLWLLSDWDKEGKAVAIEHLKRRLYMHDIQQIAIFADSCRSLPPDMTAADLATDPVLGRGPIRDQRYPAIDKFVAAQDGSATFMIPGTDPNDDRCLFSGLLVEGLWGTRPEAFAKGEPDKVTSRSLGAYLNAEVPKLAMKYNRRLFPNISPTFPEGDDIYFGSFDQHPPPNPPAFPAWPKILGTLQHQAPKFRSSKGRSSHDKVDAASASASLLMEKIRRQSRPTAFETGAGFGVEGATVRRLWCSADLVAQIHGQNNFWRIRDRKHYRLLKPVPVIIEFEDGYVAATTAIPSFIATVLRDRQGISALIYRPLYSTPETAAAAEMAITKMEAGSLRAGDAMDLAINLRQMKHVDPVLGVISAYLYDAIGDIDNIRRMAFYYLRHNQPVPYDIALLARVRAQRSREGLLSVRVPMVRKSKPRTRSEQSIDWTYSSTPEKVGPVAGAWPWMRQGWGFLGDSLGNDESGLAQPGLSELIPHLSKGRFTMFDSIGGKQLATLFDFSSTDGGSTRRQSVAKTILGH